MFYQESIVLYSAVVRGVTIPQKPYSQISTAWEFLITLGCIMKAFRQFFSHTFLSFDAE